MRPVEPRAEKRVAGICGERDTPLQQLAGVLELHHVDEGVREQHGEPHGLERVLAPLGRFERGAKDGDGGVELVDHRVRAAERVGERGLRGHVAHAERASLLELLDRTARVARVEGQLAEPGEGPRTILARGRLLERVRIELSREVALVEPERKLRVDQAGRVVTALDTRCEVVLADPEPAAHLTQELKRWDPVAGLDARDVRRRATRKRELTLAQARAFARLSEAAPDLSGV